MLVPQQCVFSDAELCSVDPLFSTNCMVHLQFRVAEQFSQLMRQYPVAIPTAYGDDYGADWTHLILTYVIQV